MAKRFEKTVKTVKKLAEIWQKLLCHWMQPGTLKPHLITVSGDLKQ
jgi:hypothetical protein